MPGGEVFWPEPPWPSQVGGLGRRQLQVATFRHPPGGAAERVRSAPPGAMAAGAAGLWRDSRHHATHSLSGSSWWNAQAAALCEAVRSYGNDCEARDGSPKLPAPCYHGWPSGGPSQDLLLLKMRQSRFQGHVDWVSWTREAAAAAPAGRRSASSSPRRGWRSPGRRFARSASPFGGRGARPTPLDQAQQAWAAHCGAGLHNPTASQPVAPEAGHFAGCCGGSAPHGHEAWPADYGAASAGGSSAAWPPQQPLTPAGAEAGRSTGGAAPDGAEALYGGCSASHPGSRPATPGGAEALHGGCSAQSLPHPGSRQTTPGGVDARSTDEAAAQALHDGSSAQSAPPHPSSRPGTPGGADARSTGEAAVQVGPMRAEHPCELLGPAWWTVCADATARRFLSMVEMESYYTAILRRHAQASSADVLASAGVAGSSTPPADDCCSRPAWEDRPNRLQELVQKMREANANLAGQTPM